MNSLIDDSRIEEMRRRWHGKNSYLRLLSLHASDKTKLALIAQVTSKFVLARQYATQADQLIAVLTVHTKGYPTLTRTVLNRDLTFVDYVNPDDSTIERWRFQTKTPPQFYGDRYICQLGAAFNDKTPIL